jgi:uncharacterized membrane protein YccF (DUF307 family)
MLWFLFAGPLFAALWLLVGALAYASFVGRPWALGCFSACRFAFLPFSTQVIPEDAFPSSIGDALWVLVAGMWLALLHAFFSLVCFATVVGMPLGRQHLRLVALAVAPRGRYIPRASTEGNALRA